MLVINQNDPSAIELACKFLREGKVISFATDTVYGVGVDASNFKAIQRLYEIKNREAKKPIAIFVKNLTAAKKIFFFGDLAQKIAEKFLPGSLTLVLKTLPQGLSCLASNLNQNSDNFLGFRIVRHDFVEKLLENFDRNLAVTSANLSGEPAAVDAEMIKNYFQNSEIDLLIDGGKTKTGVASTVVKIDNETATVLRQGAIDLTSFLKDA
jgi:L-threonylcarbamoyladenylate synthase